MFGGESILMQPWIAIRRRGPLRDRRRRRWRKLEGVAVRFEAGGVAVRERPKWRSEGLKPTFHARSEGLAMLADMFGSPFDSDTPPDVLEFLRDYNNRT